MAREESPALLHRLKHLLQQDYRGVNLAVYVAAAGALALSVQRVRPVSKFSKARQIPAHFIRNHEPLNGTYAGVNHSPVKILVDHRAPIYLPLWHSSKPPLPVKLWGVDIVSGNAVNWLQCVASGHKVTFNPISRQEDDILSTVLLHLPKQKSKDLETLDIGQKLVELGYATASVPSKLKKNSIESKIAPALLSAEARAKSYRNGVWSEKLPPLPLYVVYWRKTSKSAGELAITASKQTLHGAVVASRYAVIGAGLASKYLLVGLKNLLLLPFRKSKPAPSS